jgi:hypothetical protein
VVIVVAEQAVLASVRIDAEDADPWVSEAELLQRRCASEPGFLDQVRR